MNNEQNAKWTALCEYVEELIEQTGAPGVALGIFHKGEVAACGFGVTSIENPLPVTDETLFQIGSITKTFTGTAIMRLAEMGKLDLDGTVRTYLPEFKVQDETVSSRVTVQHLLTHMGGWDGDLFEETGSADDALANYMALMSDLAQVAPLNTVWSYNNAGFSLAGHIIEAVTEKSYSASLQELVLDPLGLRHSFLDPTEVMTRRFAVGHAGDGDQKTVLRPWPLARAAYPAGGLASNVHDLLRYARFHMSDGTASDGDTRLLAEETLAKMQAPQVTIYGKEAWGLSWAVDESHGVRQVSHGGGTLGQISLLQLVPTQDFAIAVLTNAMAGGMVTRKVTQRALQEYLSLEIPDPAPLEVERAELAAFAGHYSRPGADIDLAVLGERLVGVLNYKIGFPTRESPLPPPMPPFSLTLCDEDRLMVLDGPMKDSTADVVRTADGSIGWLRASGRIHRRA